MPVVNIPARPRGASSHSVPVSAVPLVYTESYRAVRIEHPRVRSRTYAHHPRCADIAVQEVLIEDSRLDRVDDLVRSFTEEARP